MVDPLVMGGGPPPWVIDSGPLSHFAKSGWLGLLKLVAGDRAVLVPDTVYAEIADGAVVHHHLSLVLDATSSWLSVRPVDSLEEIAAFSTFASALVGEDGKKNLGECGVLALAKTTPGIAILDDGAARGQARSAGIEHRGSVALLLDAVRDHGLPRDVAGTVADDLLASEYRLPFESGRFVRWCLEKGYLEYE